MENKRLMIQKNGKTNMTDIKTIKDELSVISKTYNEKCTDLYNAYINSIKNDPKVFSFENTVDKDKFDDICTSGYLNDTQKALLVSLLVHVTEDSNHKTLSFLLKKYVDLSNTVIDKGEDPNLSLRNVFELIYQRVFDLVNMGKNYNGELLFSYKDGIRVEDLGSLVTRYGLYVTYPIFLRSQPALHFYNGEVYLNQNVLLTSNVYDLVKREFQNNTASTSISYMTRDRKFQFTFFRNTFDVEVIKVGDKNPSIHRFTLEHVKNSNFENMGVALENIEKVKEVISMGFDSKKTFPQLSSSYSIFLGNVYKTLAGTSKSVKESADQIKGYMDITSNKD